MFLDKTHELTDHLGNVRVTFKQGTNTNLEVLSKADYYAFGGQLPGRIWQQSGGEYRYGYQGQEKSMDETNWDNFELRNFNHDLGRWSAPDPYAQFHSPYIAMANNPINMTDPDGGRTTLPGWTVGASTHDKWVSPSLAWFCAPGPIGYMSATLDLGDAIRFGVDGPESGGSSAGGGGIFGGSFWNGGLSFGQLDAMDGAVDGQIRSEGKSESEVAFNESITTSSESSIYQTTSDHYDAFVNSFGNYLPEDYSYNKAMRDYGKMTEKYFFEYINPNKPIYVNSKAGITGNDGVSVVANDYWYRTWESSGKYKNISSSVTISSGKQIVSNYESPYGDYYEQSSNISYVSGTQKKININMTIENKKIRNYDISLNNGNVRTTVRTDGVINTSVGVGNYRFGVGISQDFITTFSTTYRSNNGFGATMNYSYRAGGNTLGYFGSTLILLLTPEFIPVLGPATVPVIP